MPRPPIPLSRIALDAAYRDAFDLTESQLRLLVALVAAHTTGMGPVTATDLEALLSRDAARRTGELERMMLVECVGFGEYRKALWRASRRGYRRLGLPVPELPPIVETEVSRAEAMQDRYEQRRRARLRGERDGVGA